MKRAVITRTVLSLAVAGAFGGMASQAHASAFALTEQSASGLGNSFAGAAAVADDASVIYYNPAGMSLLPSGKEISLGAAFINISTKFNNSASTPSLGRPLGSDGGDAGYLATVPNAYFAMDITPSLKAGLGVGAPFGLKTEYSTDWMGRFQAIKSDIETLNINPSVSYKVNDTVALGFGVSYQKIDAEFTNAVNLVAAEGSADIKANDDAWGYNLGAMFQVSPETRLGVSYRSAISYHLTGTANFAGGVPIPNGNVHADIKMPDSASIALQHHLDPSWTLLADASWTGWSKIQQLNIISDASGASLSNTPENFKDTWRYGVGATYRSSDTWSIKMGLAYDQSPVNNTDRTPRLPDADRTWISVGAQYRPSSASTVDVGYAHLMVKDASINQTNPAPTGGTLVGNYKSAIDILGVQFAYRF